MNEETQVSEIIQQFDHDKDGFIEADEILKVENRWAVFLCKKREFSVFFQALEIIGSEKVKISKKHLKEIIDVVRKEQIVEEKEKKEELVAKTKQNQQQTNVSSTTPPKNV